MTRIPNSFNPPEELAGLRILGVFLVTMTLGDIGFLWNSYSYSVSDDFLAVLMTASTIAGIMGLPMLAAWSFGSVLDHERGTRASRAHLAICIASVVATVVIIVFVTVLRMGTVGVTEGGVEAASSATASFESVAQEQHAAQGESSTGSMLVVVMTGLLAATAVLSFARKLIDCSMALREPMIDSYRRRMAPKRLAQIDAALAGIAARNVEKQRLDDARLRAAAAEMAARTADEIIVGLEKEVAIASEDPASWQVAMGDGAGGDEAAAPAFEPASTLDDEGDGVMELNEAPEKRGAIDRKAA